MPSAELQDLWKSGGVQVFEIMSQPVQWISKLGRNSRPSRAIVDDLPYATEARGDGGGMEEEFAGNLVFLKTDFAPGQHPKTGDEIELARGRVIRLKQIEGHNDQVDPFFSYGYWPAKN